MPDAAVDGRGGEAPEPVEFEPPRLSLDALTALAHPLRVRILHVLTTRGAQTASSLAAELGESTGSTSYHLRQLEAKGFITEDTSLGTGRERWWRRAVNQVQVRSRELSEHADGRAASATVLGAWTQHDSALLTSFVATGEGRYDEAMLDAARVSSHSATMSASELRRLTRDVHQLIAERVAAAAPPTDGADPADRSHRIRIQFNAFPID